MTERKQKPLIEEYRSSLILSEMSVHTIRKYIADVEDFSRFAGCPAEQTEKQTVIAYKEWIKQYYMPNTVNSKLLSLNRFFSWVGHLNLRVKTERMQYHRSLENVLSEEEYYLLLAAAQAANKQKLFLIIKTLACTGIRVGELRFVTYEAALHGSNKVQSKGRLREIFLSQQLCNLLLQYCHELGVTSGPIFMGSSGKPLDTSSIWRTLKRLAAKANVEPAKVYPHSFRHLFAKAYLQHFGNIAELADLLGHASIETTRIYLVTSSSEKRNRINELSL